MDGRRHERGTHGGRSGGNAYRDEMVEVEVELGRGVGASGAGIGLVQWRMGNRGSGCEGLIVVVLEETLLLMPPGWSG